MSDFLQKRKIMIQRYKKAGYIKTKQMERAVFKVPREEFMDPVYVDYAYSDQPFPIPGDGRQTISAPYMYPIFYEPLDIKPGNKILEIGAGSGYGAALAWELVAPDGVVVAIEINPRTYQFAKSNLERTGYNQIVLIQGDGSLGYPEKSPFDAIVVTAAAPEIPQLLINQLSAPGKLMAPIGSTSSLYGQDLVMLEKDEGGNISRRLLMKVSYVPLIGKYGWSHR